MHKVWFYIALSVIVIAGVWMSLPSEEERQQMREAVQRKKAERRQKAAQTASPPAAPAPASDVR